MLFCSCSGPQLVTILPRSRSDMQACPLRGRRRGGRDRHVPPDATLPGCFQLRNSSAPRAIGKRTLHRHGRIAFAAVLPSFSLSLRDSMFGSEIRKTPRGLRSATTAPNGAGAVAAKATTDRARGLYQRPEPREHFRGMSRCCSMTGNRTSTFMAPIAALIPNSPARPSTVSIRAVRWPTMCRALSAPCPPLATSRSRRSSGAGRWRGLLAWRPERVATAGVMFIRRSGGSSPWKIPVLRKRFASSLALHHRISALVPTMWCSMIYGWHSGRRD